MLERHPLDPDPVPSTKPPAVLALGVVAVMTGPLLAGVIPAALALVLARQARAELASSGGYLTGGPRLRLGVRLAWLGILLAVAGAVAMTVVGLLTTVRIGGIDFPSRFD